MASILPLCVYRYSDTGAIKRPIIGRCMALYGIQKSGVALHKVVHNYFIYAIRVLDYPFLRLSAIFQKKFSYKKQGIFPLKNIQKIQYNYPIIMSAYFFWISSFDLISPSGSFMITSCSCLSFMPS